MSEILELLVGAVESVYVDDEGKPGVLVTKIANNTWYASIGRYKKVGSENRSSVCAAKGPTPDQALMALARDWLQLVVTPELSALAGSLGLCEAPPDDAQDKRKVTFEEDDS